MALNTKTRKLAVTGMMTAIMIVMGTTPLGFIPIGPFKITIMHLPVIIGAILEGPVVGLVLGLFFGLFSLYQAVTAPTILSPLFMDPLVSVLPRMLIGLTSYYAYAGIERLFRNRNLSPLPLGEGEGRLKRFFKRSANLLRTNTNSLSVGTSALVGTATNTVLVLGAIYLLHAASYAELMGIKPAVVSATLISTAVVNGVPECLTAIVVTTAVVLAVKKIKFPRKGAA